MKTKSEFKVTLFAGLVMATALATGAHAATFIANTGAASGTLQTPGPTDIHNANSGAPVTSTSASAEDRSGDQAAKASSSANASAEVGAVHGSSVANADTFAVGCCTSALASGSTYAEYNDTFVLHSASIADGVTAHFVADILISGAAGGAFTGDFWNANGFWRATTAVNGQSFVEGFSTSGDGTNGFTSSGSNTFGHQFFGFDVVLGQATTMFLRVETGAQAGAGGFGVNSSEFTVDLGHTVSWQGIGGVIIGGQAVADFTAISPDTGFDFVKGYRAPGGGTSGVPEPSTWAMLILGLRRRRRHGAAPAADDRRLSRTAPPAPHFGSGGSGG